MSPWPSVNHVQVGFQWSRQDSTLSVGGSVNRELSSLVINSYHGVFTYNLGRARDMVRPFVFGGVGATNYNPEDFMGFSIGSETQFSTTFGGGVKVFPSEHIGFSAAARLTPTYIKSDPEGVCCSPYWSPYYPGGCAVLLNHAYSNQFDFSGGINVRF